jgi:hypothetical protein
MNDLQKVEKYLNFLRDVKTKLDTTSKISMSDYIAKHKISKRATQALQDGGILRKTSCTRHAKWYWASPVIPNIKMADELYGRCIKLNNDYQIKHRAEMAIEGKTQFTEALKEAMIDKLKEDRVVLESAIWSGSKEGVVEKHSQMIDMDKVGRNVTVQYREPQLIKVPSLGRTPTQRPVKEQVAPVVEREKLFSVLWGVIKIKW